MKSIQINTIPDSEQRYDTTGDYFTNKTGAKQIVVSSMEDERYEFLIAIHELVESYLCYLRGIDEASIDTFDLAYESKRNKGDIYSEPGDQPEAPYHREHVFATTIEKLLAKELGVDWEAYSQACALLTQPPRPETK